MTEEEARRWLASRYTASRIAKLDTFVQMLAAEAERQSLIARSTFGEIWGRHIVDSAQLLELARADGHWLDIGSGGGLPGMVIAILRDDPVTLCEPRRKRADFLAEAASQLQLPHVHVAASRVQTLSGVFDIVSARAVAALPEIFGWTSHLVSRETRYVLQRGRNWQEDVAVARRAWHGVFHVEQSLTEPGSGIVIAYDVRPQ